jgi:hypothetical protein
MNRTGQVDFASGANIVLGAWMVISPFIFGYSGNSAALWNDIIFGVVVLLLAWARVANPGGVSALSWINAVIGLWLIAVPFVFGFTTNAVALWNNIIAGALVTILGVWSALATNTAA